MKRQIPRVLLASLIISGASHVLAQEPSLYLKIIREDIKSGKAAAHEKSEMAFVRAFSKSKYPNYVAWEAMTGLSQAWFLERYDSYAAIEAASKISNSEPMNSTLGQLDEVDGALRTGERTMILRYQKDLSYTPVPANLARVRYVWVSTWQIRPGHSTEFAENRKLWNAAAEKIGSKMRRAVYLSATGGLTYYSLSGMESLKAMDETGGVVAALFGPDRERYYKLMQDAVASEDSIWFVVNPKMSYPPKEYIAADPDFWAPKPKPAAK
jgi:hypothetical protein